MVYDDIGSGFDSLFGPSTILDNEIRCLFQRDMRGAETNIIASLGEAHGTFKELLGLSVFLIRRLRSYRQQLVKDLMSDKGLSSLVRTGRRQDPLRAARHVHNIVCDRWLEFHFAIEPDVQDACDIYNVITGGGLNKALTQRPRVHKVKTFCNVSTSNLVVPFGSVGPDSTGAVPKVTVTKKRLVLAALGASLFSRPSWQGDMASQLDWTASGVLPALWELVPYSWAIDYFTNIGSLIEAYTTPQYPTFNSWASVLVRDELIRSPRSWSHMGYQSAKAIRYVGSLGEAKQSLVRFQRTINVGLMPHFEWKYPKPVQIGTLWSALHFFRRRSVPFSLPFVGSWT